MKQTENYQLNQWEKPDRIMMENFNADNAKIDGALKANAAAISAEETARKAAITSEANARTAAVNTRCKFVDVGTFSAQVDRSTGQLTLNAPVNYGNYLLVVLEFTIPSNNTNWHIQPNGTGSFGRGYSGVRFFALPMRNPDAYAIFYPLNGLNTPGVAAVNARCSYGELNRFVFYPEDPAAVMKGTATVRVLAIQ